MNSEPAAPASATGMSAAPARRESLRARWNDAVGWIWRARVDVAIVATLTVVAAVLRLWDLGHIPLGLHGDEALTGIDARRVLREGWIGPYVESALGQPAGPLYVIAPLFKVLPGTTFTVRFAMALFGIATIPLAYLAFATMFNRRVAAFAAVLLAVMTWHLHLGRTAFMVSSWPFMEMAVLWALFAALQRRSFGLMAVAGALAGLGVYTYNAYLLFLPVVAVSLVWMALFERERDRTEFGLMVALFACVALLVSVPMLRYADTHTALYREHQQIVSVTNTPEWDEEEWTGRADILLERGEEWGRALVFGDRPDFGDGLASEGQPVVDPVTVVLAACGLLMALYHWRSPAHATLIAAVLILPLGALLTTGDGLFRRTFGLAPFIAVLGALPLAWAWDWVAERPRRLRNAGVATFAVLLVAVGVRNTYSYFGPVQDSFVVSYVYPYQMDAASRFLDGVPRDTVVYFYSDRWSVEYETRQYLAPDIGDRFDRSREFRGIPFEITPEPVDYEADRTRDTVFVFLGSYVDDLDLVLTRYPGGRVTEEIRGSEVLYRAYALPAEPS